MSFFFICYTPHFNKVIVFFSFTVWFFFNTDSLSITLFCPGYLNIYLYFIVTRWKRTGRRTHLTRTITYTLLCPVSFYSVLFSLFLILCLHCTSPSIWRIPTPLQTIPFSIAISFSSLWYECFHWVHRPS